ncbi:Trihelix transcription factor ASIL2 [Bienertia sinuspersici]
MPSPPSSPPPENPPIPSSQPQPPPQPPPPVVVRKFPAPCWTQDETLALIQAYQDKWFSLRRRNLRTADWEAVADEVNRRCPDQSPPKTSAQCRHKMEKLRKRYRTEKQRIANLPPHHHHHFPGNSFFPPSSWVFFDLMDAMEIGPAPGNGMGMNLSSGFNVHNPNPNPSRDKDSLNFMNQNLQNGGFVKEEKMRGKEDLGKHFDDILKSIGKGGISAPIKFRVKDNNHFDDSKYDYDGSPGFDYNNSNSSRRNFEGASASGSRFNTNNNKRKFGGGGGGSGFINGCSSSKRGSGSGSGAKQRGDGVVGDMVASINMLGDGLLKMEKMKMELMQDLQRQRMEMEINNSRMILESQHSIVNAFLQGFNKLNKVTQSHSQS